MKFFQPLLFLATCLAATHAQTTTGSAATPSGTGAPAPAVPSFVNTPGLKVTSPMNGMTVIQDTNLGISGTIGERTISTINITVSKKDGSGTNTTIVDVKQGSAARLNQIWKVDSTKFPAGEYLMTMVITPNVTAPPNNSGIVPGPTAVVPPAQVPPPTGPQPMAYYWQGTINIQALKTTTPTSDAFKITATTGLVKMMAALGVVALGCIVTL